MRLDFGQILDFFFFFFFFSTVMDRIFKKLRHYFPIPLGIRESFREIAARRKRVNLDLVLMAFVTSWGAERVKKQRNFAEL